MFYHRTYELNGVIGVVSLFGILGFFFWVVLELQTKILCLLNLIVHINENFSLWVVILTESLGHFNLCVSCVNLRFSELRVILYVGLILVYE